MIGFPDVGELVPSGWQFHSLQAVEHKAKRLPGPGHPHRGVLRPGAVVGVPGDDRVAQSACPLRGDWTVYGAVPRVDRQVMVSAARRKGC